MATLDEVMQTDIAFTNDFGVGATGDIDTIAGLANLKQALFNRLTTEQGSLIHRATYGVGVRQWQNAPATLASKRSLALRIQEQFLLDDRVEEVTGVSINFDDINPSKTVIVVRVKAKGYDETQMSFIPFGEGV
jgi:hypothetical protein